jgi:hypothetical protein
LVAPARRHVDSLYEAVFGLHSLTRAGVRQVWNPQMHGDDSRQTRIIGVQCARHRRESRHEALGSFVAFIRALQQPLDLQSLADNETPRALLDQRRSAEEEPVFGTG